MRGYKIAKSIPLTPKHGGRAASTSKSGRKVTPVYLALERLAPPSKNKAGQDLFWSFHVPAKSPEERKTLQKRITGIIVSYNKRNKQKHATRQTPKGVRVWRIA